MIISWPGQLSRCSDLLWLWRSENEIPVGSTFSAPTQSSSVPCAPFSSKLGYKVSWLGVKRPERVVDHPSSPSAEVKGSVEVYLYSPSGHTWLVLVWTAAQNWKCCSINCAHINYFFLFVGSTYWWCLRKSLSYSMRRTKVSENQTASIFSVTKATQFFKKLVGAFYQSTWQNIPGNISNFLPINCRKKAVSHTSYPRTLKV